MTSDSIDWTQEAELDPEKEYRALVRSIRYNRGFELLFVQCSPAEGTRLVKKVRKDLPNKKIEVLTLEEPIDNLYDVIDALPGKDQINALFIEGIERSLYEYEKEQLWQDSIDRRNYSEKKIPRLLGHLNLGRERFRDHFKFCIIFLVPKFALKYLIRRAPDFFDWRSGVLEFVMETERLQQEYQQVYFARSEREDYLSLTPQHRRDEILRIQALLEEPEQTPKQKAGLYYEQARLHDIAGEYEGAITSCDQALKYKPDYHQAWNSRGTALDDLRRYEEAIASYDQALKYKPDYHKAWNNRGYALFNLKRYEEAIASYDQALQYKLDNHKAWYNRGIALNRLNRYEEAIASYDQALKYKPDYHKAWNNRGYALFNLKRYEEAIASCDQALQYKPDLHQAWNNRGYALFNLKRYEEAIASYDKSLEFLPNNANAFYNKSCCYGLQGKADDAIEQLKQAINLDPKYRDMARTDSDFDSIRNDDRFQALLNEQQNE